MTIEIQDLCPMLYVFDMTASIAFYRVLGFEIFRASPPIDGASTDRLGWAWLRCGEVSLMLNSAYDPDDVRPPARDALRVTAHEDTALYIGCPDVDAAWEHLRSNGIVVDPPSVAHYGMKQLYLKDPDGFTVCFQWPVDAPAGA